MTEPQKRGAPQGNLNALKHGLYSRQFREPETADLNQHSRSLQEEIKLLRKLNRRIEKLTSEESYDLKQLGYLIDLNGKTSCRISTLLLAEQKLNAANSEYAGILSQAMAETLSDLSKPERRRGGVDRG
jgi:hypothetical protein